MYVPILAVIVIGIVAFIIGTLYGFLLAGLCHAAKSSREEGDECSHSLHPSDTKDMELKIRETDK